jgi:O-antigen/teichoic acid export membrane protein
VISIAVSQVNLREVAEIVRNGGNARKHVLKIGGTLWLITILPLVIVLIWGPDLFAMIFGSEWREAGEYMRLMAPAFAARVVASPLSTTIGATQNNLLGMSWKVLAFTTNLIVLLSLAYGGDPKTVILGLGISDFCLYLLYQAMIFHAAGKPRPA